MGPGGRRARGHPDRAVPRTGRACHRSFVLGLRRALAVVGGGPRGLLGCGAGALRGAPRRGRGHRAPRPPDAGSPVVPRDPTQLRRGHAGDARPRRRRRDGPGPQPERSAARPHRGRAARPGGPGSGGPGPPRRAARRPGGGVPAERARGAGAADGHRQPGRGVLLMCARVRHPQRRRPVEPDRAGAARRRRRLPLWRQAGRPARRSGRDRRGAAQPASRRPRPVPRPGGTGRSRRDDLGGPGRRAGRAGL